MYHSKIAGLGYYVPSNVVTNDDLTKIIDTTDVDSGKNGN
jgi:3-oxoacyl-[acyl-carrier-protein] synthase-3